MKLMILKINFKDMASSRKTKQKTTLKKPKRKMRNTQEMLKEKFIQELTINPFIETACRKLRVSRATIYRWLKDDYSFKRDVDEAITVSNGSINDLAKSKLVEAIKNNDSGMIKYHLSRRHEEYMDKKDATTENKYILTPEKKEEINRKVKLWTDTLLKDDEDDEDVDDSKILRKS
jgi:hypothetical protein